MPENKQERKKPGPEAETLKIEGMDWEEAVKVALQKKRPPEGFPQEPKKKRGEE